MRGSVSDVMRCFARGCTGCATPVLGRSIFRIMIAWSTVAAWRRAVGHVEHREPLRRVGARARDDQLALARAQLARRRDERAERLVGHGDGAREVDDQPAHAAGQRGVDRARELAERGRVERPAHVELVDDVVEPLLTDRERSWRDDGAQGLRGEHGDPGRTRSGRIPEYGCSRVLPPHADLGRPDELPARARHAPGHPGARGARRGGARDGARLRADARPARPLRDPARGDRAPPRRPPGRQGRSAWRRARWRSRTGPRAAASTPRSATARTTSRSPRSCSASRARRRSTTSGRPSSTRSTAASRAASSCPTRSRPSGSPATARAPASCARTRA